MKLNRSSNQPKTITTLFIIGLIVGQCQVNGFFFVLTALSSIVQISYNVYGVLNDAHDTYNKLTTASTQDVFDKVIEIAETLDKIGTKLDKKLDNTLSTLLRRLPLANKIDENVQELNQYLVRVDSLYNDFEEYIKDHGEFDSLEIDALVEASASRDAGDIRDVIDKMHSLIVPGRLGSLKKSLLLLLAEETQEYALELCDTGAPPQQRLFELYSIVMITELRSYAMSSFAYLQKTMDEGKNYMNSVERLREKFELRAKQYLLALKNAMYFAALQFRRCDPPEGHIRGESFFEFERFLLIFVVQEIALMRNHKCNKICNTIPTPTIIYPSCQGFECSGSSSTCYGHLEACESLGASSLCEFVPPTQSRRYQFIHTYGDTNRACEGEMWYPNTYFQTSNTKCDVCRCTCCEDAYKSKSDHFVNLRPQESDIENNKVITGVRFRMENRVLHIQIQEGRLEANFTISDETTGWKELEDIQYDEESSINEDEFILNKKWTNETNSWSERLNVGEDIGVLTIAGRRFFLDTLHVPEHHIVTGVKFARMPSEKSTAQPIYLMIRYTEFDFNTGKLKNLESSQWMSYEDTPYGKAGNYRQESENDQPHNPLKYSKTTVTSHPNEYIDLASSSYWHDAGQTTVPLLDALPLYANPLTPLSGIGLYQKTAESGGFLTFIVEGINIAPYIAVDE